MPEKWDWSIFSWTPKTSGGHSVTSHTRRRGFRPGFQFLATAAGRNRNLEVGVKSAMHPKFMSNRGGPGVISWLFRIGRGAWICFLLCYTNIWMVDVKIK